MSTITSLSQPRRWRALPPHLHLPKRVPTITTLAHPAPAAAAALPCVFPTNSATPMACAASAPSPLQARATDTSPLGPRCSCSLNICVYRRVNLLTARTASAFSLPNACVFRHKAGPPGTGCSRSFTSTSSLNFISCAHRHASHADGVCRSQTTLFLCKRLPTHCQLSWLQNPPASYPSGIP